MTKRPRRPCSQPGCPETTPGGGLCANHRRRRDSQRGAPSTRGYGEAWRRTRGRFLDQLADRQGNMVPMCEECGSTAGETGAPLHVDHIDGLGPNGPRGHDFDNLQALCAPCHGRKTRHQTGTTGAPQ